MSSSAYPKSSGGSNGASDDEDGGLANSMRSSLPAQEVRPRHLTLETSAAQVDSTDQYSPLPSSMSKERRRSAVASVTFDESEKAEIGDEKERYHDAVKGSKPLSEIIQPSSSVLSSSLQRASPEMMTSPIGSRGARSAALVATIDTDALAQRTEEALQRMQKSIIDSAAMEKEYTVICCYPRYYFIEYSFIRSMASQMSELKRFFASTSSSNSDDLLTAQKRIRELESQVSSLVTEVSALKDAAAISALQAVENEKYLKARHAEELASLEKRFEESRADVSRRHQEGVDALKRLHIEEIASVRERSKDGQALEALATQIRTTSGVVSTVLFHVQL